MKLTSIPLSAFVAFALTASSVKTPAQTPVKAAHRAAPHSTSRTTAHTESSRDCSKLPVLSPNIPALPAGLPCARPLYTIATIPSARIVGTSPLESHDLRDILGIEPTTFSLDYIDTRIGAGALAAPHQWYTVKYTGYLTDGVKFDSTDDHADKAPFTFEYGKHQVIVGWDTGLDGMRVGGKRRLFIPWQLAYGPTQHGTIPAKSELVFDIELLGQSDKPPMGQGSPVIGFGSGSGIAGSSSGAARSTAPVVTIRPESPATAPAPPTAPKP